ncbi:MAG: sensor histidine kinase [bacterium]|nr:sensor histidine kinase [bacterium]
MSARIVVLVLAVLTVFTVLLFLTAFSVTKTWLEQTAVANLGALASARQVAIEENLTDYLDTLGAVVHPDLNGQVTRLLGANNPTREEIRAEIEVGLRHEVAVDDELMWVKVLDLEKEIVAFSSLSKTTLSTSEANVGFEDGQDRTFISDPFPVGGRLFLHLVAPLNDGHGETLAVVILRFDARAILSIVGDYTGLGDTGETVLGTRHDDRVLFLTPLRFDPNLSEIKPAAANGERAKPMIHATAGQSGTTRAPDYRQTRVIAAYRPISPTGWGIVVKQDVAETLASVKRLQTALIGSFLGLLFLGATTVFLLVKNFMRPLGELERATRKVARGDLSTRLPVITDDEVGRLAGSFNAMVDHLETTRSDLEQKNQELSSFAYVVSHDLKAPLRSLEGHTSWLEDELADTLDGEQRNRLTLMRDRVRRMELLIEGLLQLARTGHGGRETSVDLKQLLGSVIMAADPPEGFQISLPDDLPVIETQEAALGQVLQHLVRNAVVHHPKPDGRIEIGYIILENETIEFFVSDDGAGIEPRYHERIFEVFHTLKSWDEGQNTGIGLAVVKKMVESNGGRVWVESDGEPGHGSIFHFCWPIGVRNPKR